MSTCSKCQHNYFDSCPFINNKEHKNNSCFQHLWYVVVNENNLFFKECFDRGYDFTEYNKEATLFSSIEEVQSKLKRKYKNYKIKPVELFVGYGDYDIVVSDDIVNKKEGDN